MNKNNEDFLMKNFNLLVWKIDGMLERNPGYQLQEFITHIIVSTGLSNGDPLPSQRKFAALNDISVKTVKRVYFQLASTGWIRTVPGSGTFVDRETDQQKRDLECAGFTRRLPVPLPHRVFESDGNPATHVNFLTVGIDTLGPAFSPIGSLMKHMKYYQKKYETATQMQQVNDLLGSEYREAIRKYFKHTRAFRIDPGTIDISFGRLASLKHILTLLLDKGDIIVNTASQDAGLGQVLHELEVDDHHLSTTQPDFIANLETLLQANPIKVLYLRPQWGYPEGNNLPAEDCIKILALAKKYHFYILEEDVYHEFWYEDKPYRPLAAYDHEGHVIYMGVLSQLSVYMLNTMVICASQEFIDLFRSVPKDTYSYRNLIEEKAITDMLDSGDLWKLVSKARHTKALEKERLEFILQGYLGSFLRIGPSSSGLCLWIIFPESVNLQAAMEYLGQRNVEVPFLPSAVMPNIICYYMRLGFGTFNEDEALNAAMLLKAMFENFNKG
jgi:GntR family transcriptional regulator/MocR family aminotransferase